MPVSVWENTYTLDEQVGGGKLTPFQSGNASPGSYTGTTQELTERAAIGLLRQGFCVIVDRNTAEVVKETLNSDVSEERP